MGNFIVGINVEALSHKIFALFLSLPFENLCICLLGKFSSPNLLRNVDFSIYFLPSQTFVPFFRFGSLWRL